MKTYITVPKHGGVFQSSLKPKRAKFNVRAVAVTQTVVGAILFLLCSLLVVLFPGATAKFTAYAFHTDLSRIMQPPSFSGFIIGLIVFSLGFGLISALAASVYNNLTKNAA